MQLKARCPSRRRSSPARTPTSFDGAQVFADSLAYANPKPSFAGYDEYDGPPGRARRERLHRPEQDRARRRSNPSRPAEPDARRSQ